MSLETLREGRIEVQAEAIDPSRAEQIGLQVLDLIEDGILINGFHNRTGMVIPSMSPHEYPITPYPRDSEKGYRLVDRAKLTDDLNELIEDKATEHAVAQEKTGGDPDGHLHIKIKLHKGRPFPMHRDEKSSLTSATNLLGHANLARRFRRQRTLQPGDELRVHSGQEKRPLHGIYQTSNPRVSLVVRSYK